MTGTVLLLGASGKIGRAAAQVFWDRGWRVRMYDRAVGDMVRQAQGVDVIVNGLNPPNYHDWAGLLPQITRDVIAAAQASGATVILPGNVYVYGNTPGLWTEETLHQPCSRKGRIREEIEQMYRAAGVQTIILRAGDFISAEAGDSDLMGVVHLKGLKRGVVTALGDPDAMHAYGYLPDWAEAACQLAERRKTLAAFTDVNLGGANFTMNDLAAVLAQHLGLSVRVKQFGWWQMRLLAPFSELARELLEMRYLWSVPHRLNHDKLLSLLPDFKHTDLATVMVAGVPRG